MPPTPSRNSRRCDRTALAHAAFKVAPHSHRRRLKTAELFAVIIKSTEEQSMRFRLALAITLMTWLGYNPQALAQISDARRYCAQVRDDDAIRELPRSLALDALKAGSSDTASDSSSQGGSTPPQMSKEDIDSYVASTVFRCMNGLVFICNYGANIPCGGRPDTRRRMPEVDRYCRQNPNDEIVPMAVTGHSTIYAWACERGKPRITYEGQLDGSSLFQKLQPIDFAW